MQPDAQQQQEEELPLMNWMVRWQQLSAPCTEAFVSSRKKISVQKELLAEELQLVNLVLSVSNKSDYCTGIHLSRCLEMGLPSEDARRILHGELPSLDMPVLGQQSNQLPDAYQNRNRLRQIVAASRLSLEARGDRLVLTEQFPDLTEEELFVITTAAGIATLGNLMNRFAAPEMELIFHLALDRYKSSGQASKEPQMTKPLVPGAKDDDARVFLSRNDVNIQITIHSFIFHSSKFGTSSARWVMKGKGCCSRVTCPASPESLFRLIAWPHALGMLLIML